MIGIIMSQKIKYIRYATQKSNSSIQTTKLRRFFKNPNYFGFISSNDLPKSRSITSPTIAIAPSNTASITMKNSININPKIKINGKSMMIATIIGNILVILKQI